MRNQLNNFQLTTYINLKKKVYIRIVNNINDIKFAMYKFFKKKYLKAYLLRISINNRTSSTLREVESHSFHVSLYYLTLEFV